MRVFEVFLRSGAKVDIEAELMHEDKRNGDRLFFYSDNSMSHVIAYFNRSEVAGVIFGNDQSTMMPPRKNEVLRR